MNQAAVKQALQAVWTCPDFVDALLCYGLAQRILFVLSRRGVAQVRV